MIYTLYCWFQFHLQIWPWSINHSKPFTKGPSINYVVFLLCDNPWNERPNLQSITTYCSQMSILSTNLPVCLGKVYQNIKGHILALC